MGIHITPVRARAQLKQFITMVWSLYQGDPNWVPPIIMDRKKLLDTKRNPFYKHAHMELFLAHKDGAIAGRIGAIVNHAHNEIHNDKVGFFGFFECINNQNVADALFRAAETWLAEQGMEHIRGPVNPSMNDEAGLLVDGFNDPPQILMTYNPKYYSSLIETHGFTTAKDLYAYQLTAEGRIEKLQRVQQLVRQREKITVREVNFKDNEAFKRDVATLKYIYNAAWQPNWGFVKMTTEEFDFLAADLKQVANPDLALIIESAGEPIGFTLAFPDINQSMIHNKNGSLLGAAWQLLFGKKHINRGRIIVLGVIPERQRLGIDAVLYDEIGVRMFDALGYKEIEASWILEDNMMMNRALQMMKGERYKTYRLYEKTINKN